MQVEEFDYIAPPVATQFSIAESDVGLPVLPSLYKAEKFSSAQVNEYQCDLGANCGHRITPAPIRSDDCRLAKFLACGRRTQRQTIDAEPQSNAA